MVSNGVTSTRSFSSATATSSNARQSDDSSATSPNKADSAHSDVPLGPPSAAAMLDVRIFRCYLNQLLMKVDVRDR